MSQQYWVYQLSIRRWRGRNVIAQLVDPPPPEMRAQYAGLNYTNPDPFIRHHA